MFTPRVLVVTGATVVALAGGCADEEAPQWLSDLGPTTTTTAAPDATATTTPAGATTTSVPAGEPVTALAAGDCVIGDAFGGTEPRATEAEVVPCTESHDAEVVGLVTYEQPTGEPYPGQEQVAAFAEENCATVFEEYVGVPFGSSEYQLLTLWPTEDSWAADDREGVCLAFSDAGPLTASVAGAAS